jgi:synaptobrevin homolog YKT6
MSSMPGFILVHLGYVQDPHQADKLAKIQSDLDETKVVLHRTIESMLERGEKLDTLVGKSEDLSMASQMFYKQVDRCNTASQVSGSSTLCVIA